MTKELTPTERWQSLYDSLNHMAKNATQSGQMMQVFNNNSLVEMWNDKAQIYKYAANQIAITCALSNIFLVTDEPIKKQDRSILLVTAQTY